jgi:hypothetical protein
VTTIVSRQHEVTQCKAPTPPKEKYRCQWERQACNLAKIRSQNNQPRFTPKSKPLSHNSMIIQKEQIDRDNTNQKTKRNITTNITWLYTTIINYKKTKKNTHFYVHGSMHRESMSIIVQQDATIYSFIIFLQKQLYMFRMIPSSVIRSTCKL